MNYSTLRYDEEFPFIEWDKQWRSSFTGGATIDVLRRGRFTLVSGVRYVQEGNKVQYDDRSGFGRLVGEFRMVLNYLTVPALAEIRLLRSQRWFITVGPEIGFLLSGRITSEDALIIGNNRNSDTGYDNIRKDIKPLNVILDAGAGLEFPMENHLGVVQIRYVHGLTGIAEEDSWYSDFKTQGVELLTGVRW